jgi:hypothetical protein
MKYVKMLALAAVAAGALMAFLGAGTASATVICSTTADPCPAGQAWPNTSPIDFSIPSGSSAILKDTSGNELDKCSGSTVNGEITNTGSATETVTGTIKELTWTNCLFPTKTVSTDNKLKVHKIAGTSNGTVTSDTQIEVTINTILFGSCIYGVPSTTDVGTITEGSGTGATFHANAIASRFGSNFACPSTSRWTGTYVLTSPSETTLSVSESGT